MTGSNLIVNMISSGLPLATICLYHEQNIFWKTPVQSEENRETAVEEWLLCLYQKTKKYSVPEIQNAFFA